MTYAVEENNTTMVIELLKRDAHLINAWEADRVRTLLDQAGRLAEFDTKIVALQV